MGVKRGRQACEAVPTQPCKPSAWVLLPTPNWLGLHPIQQPFFRSPSLICQECTLLFHLYLHLAGVRLVHSFIHQHLLSTNSASGRAYWAKI